MRRASPYAAVAAVLILVAAYWGVQRWADHREGHTATTSAPISVPPVPGVPPRPADAIEMVMLYAYDGDTIQARAKASSPIITTTEPIRIRIVGINATEGTPTKQCWSQEARSALASLLPKDSRIWVAPDKNSWDDYGRRLFNVWSADGTFVDYWMVADGNAEAIRVYPNITYYPLLAATQDAAQRAKKGLWGTCGSFPARPTAG